MEKIINEVEDNKSQLKVENPFKLLIPGDQAWSLSQIGMIDSQIHSVICGRTARNYTASN